MYDRILVPVDGSACADRGLDEACRLATLCRAQLRLVHVVDELSLVMGMGSLPALSPESERLLREGGAEILATAQARALAHGVPATQVDTLLIDSFGASVAEQVLKQAAAWDAELLVLGTHGRRGMRRLLLGSDAEQIVRLAPMPVLLVRGSEPAAGGDKH